MEKELLTKGRIKADLQQQALRIVPSCLLLFLFIGVFCLFTKNFLEKEYVFLSVFSIFFGGCLVIGLILNIVKIVSILNAVSNNKFILRSDFVTNKLYKKIGRRYTVGRPYTLVFANNGNYRVLNGTYYKWSKQHTMSERKVYDSTDLRDEFYVICVKKEIALAYNKKYFELEE